MLKNTDHLALFKIGRSTGAKTVYIKKSGLKYIRDAVKNQYEWAGISIHREVEQPGGPNNYARSDIYGYKHSTGNPQLYLEVVTRFSSPISLSASQSEDNINLTWKDDNDRLPEDIQVRYKIYRSTSNAFSTAQKISTTSKLNYADDAAIAGTEYYYWITTYTNSTNNDYESRESSVVSKYIPIGLTLSKSSVSLGSANNSSSTFGITSNTSWTISSSRSWINISSSSGSGNKTITISVDENTSTSSRSGTVTVKTADGNVSKTVSVSQSAAAAKTLTVSKSSISLGAASNRSKTFGITSNTSWTVSRSGGWISVTPTSGSGNKTITVSVDENTSTSSKSGTVTVKTADGSVSKTISVSQDGKPSGKTLSVSKSSITLGSAKNSSETFTISSNTSWSVVDNGLWLSVSSSSGSMGKTISVTANSANPETASRSCIVTVKTSDGSVSRTIDVSQSGGATKTLSVSESSMSLGSTKNSSSTFTIYSNTSWTVVNNKDWIHSTYPSGSLNKTVTVTVDENTLESSRLGAVTVKTSDGSISKVVTISQSGVVGPNNPPSAPKNPTPEADAIVSSSPIVFSWECEDSDGDDLVYQIRLFAEDTRLIMTKEGLTSSTYTYSEELEDGIYHWKIIASDLKSYSTSEWTFTYSSKNSLVINSPSPADNEKVSRKPIEMSWNCEGIPEGETVKYRLAIIESGKQPVVETVVDSPKYTFKDAKPATSYFWLITAEDKDGRISEGKSYSFKTTSDLHEGFEKVVVSPVVVTDGVLNISFPDFEGEYTVEVRDMVGKLHSTNKYTKPYIKTLNLSNLEGVYIISVIFGKEMIVRRILVL
jgi:hypothetical protein